MDSTMVDVDTKWEILVERDQYRQFEYTPMSRSRIHDDRVWTWLKTYLSHNVDLTEEEERDMKHSQYIDRTLSFEVKVEHRDGMATGATCQTVLPKMPEFVKAWLELEAMRQFNHGKEGH